MYVCDTYTCACTSTHTVYMYIMYVRMYVGLRLYIYISLYVCYTRTSINVSPCLCVQMTVGWELIGHLSYFGRPLSGTCPFSDTDISQHGS